MCIQLSCTFLLPPSISISFALSRSLSPLPPSPPSLLSPCPLCLQERNIFLREAMQNTYRPSSYVVASCLVYIPLFLLIALAITLESWWCVGLSGGVQGAVYLFCLAFLCLFTGNAIATFFSAFMKK